MTDNVWSLVLEDLRQTIQPEEYRRWFSASSQAGDAGDLISVWVPSAADGRHIQVHYLDVIRPALAKIGRPNVLLRFVPTGYEEDEDEVDE
ncbi:MAG: DnaA N-terminal domain-containing protein [Vicinamibacterales bacterium]